MAKKKLAAIVKIQIPAGQATPAPPVGTALGPHGINIMDFCKAYNATTENQRGLVIPAEISIYEDRIVHVRHQDAAHAVPAAPGRRASRRASQNAARREGRHGHPAQVRQIAETKMPDLNAIDIEGAMAQVEGTARSMGIEVVD